MITPEPPSTEPTVLTRDPVRVAYVIYLAAQGIVSALLLSGTVSEVQGGTTIAIAAVVYGAVSELFVRKETVPRAPLAQLAREFEHQGHQAAGGDEVA